jgi:hypothetical protein
MHNSRLTYRLCPTDCQALDVTSAAGPPARTYSDTKSFESAMRAGLVQRVLQKVVITLNNREFVLPRRAQVAPRKPVKSCHVAQHRYALSV